MTTDNIVQFVCFETKLGSEQFVAKWEQFIRSVNSDSDVILQQSEKNGVFRYVAQHRCESNEFQFVFTKGSKSSRTPEVEIKVRQAGGYSILQEERKNGARGDESKVLVFLASPRTDLAIYRQLAPHSKLNIYEAYYENCQYAYVLEFFVKEKYISTLSEQLKQLEGAEAGMYRECTLQNA